MAIIERERTGGVVVLKLNRGVTNPVNMELVDELTRHLLNIKNDPEIRGIVLTGVNDKFFSIGFDIPELFPLPRDEFQMFYHSFNQLCIVLYSLPGPTIAAIRGHAIAAGCILALCCDYRFMAAGKTLMGLNEIKLGVPVPYPAHCILRELIGARTARIITDSGEFYPPEKLFQMGMVDEVLPPEKVLSRAITKAESLGALPLQALGTIKQNRVELLKYQINNQLEEKEQEFVDCWYSPEARQRLKEAMKKF